MKNGDKDAQNKKRRLEVLLKSSLIGNKKNKTYNNKIMKINSIKNNICCYKKIQRKRVICRLKNKVKLYYFQLKIID